MTQMTVTLPEELLTFLNRQVSSRGYESAGEYVRELIRKNRDAEELRSIMLKGASSPVIGEMDDAYFQRLHEKVQNQSK